MKKLMFTAAVAAMGACAFADAMVHEMTLSIKTTKTVKGAAYLSCGGSSTECSEGTGMCCDLDCYRTKTSVKVLGLFWGCECESLLTQDLNYDQGVFFWNATTKSPFKDTAGNYIKPEFGWDLAPQRIGKDGAGLEAVWDIVYGDTVLRGAGFGKPKGCAENAYIASLSGNFAGTTVGNYYCKVCEDDCDKTAWPLCEDCGEDVDDRTAAYGTWSLKYNSSLTKKFEKNGGSDFKWASSKMPDSVQTAAEYFISGEDPEDPTTTVTTAEKAYKAAVATYIAATNASALATAEAEKLGKTLQNVRSSEQWIAGTNETVKLFAAVKTAKQKLNSYASDDNYKATFDYVKAAGDVYANAMMKYIEKSVAFELYAVGSKESVEAAEKEKDSAYVALENALTEAPGGATVKANLTSAAKAYADAALAYYSVAAKYVSKETLDNNSWDIDYANLDNEDVEGWDWSNEGKWIPTVCAKEVNATFEEAAKDAEAKAVAAAEAKDDMNTKKSICQALGGDCK